MFQGVNVVPLPIADPDGDPITCRMSTTTESSIGTVATTGGQTISVSSDCVLTWDASAAALNSRYAVQVMITDVHGDATDDIALDFMIEIVGGAANQFPTCVLGGAAANVLPINVPFSIGMIGDDPDGGTLTANALGMPAGATFGPASGAAPLATSFSWTPGALDAGSAYAISVVYADSGNLQALCSFSIEVEAVPAGPTCDGLLATIIGTPGDDDIYGTPGDDVIVGLAGADNIHGLGGNDTICGNEDRDQIDGGEGNDRIFGNEGPDRLHGKAGADYIDGGDGDDVVYGGNGNDEIHGGANNDRLKGENGDDTIFGDAGNDTIDGRNGFDLLYGGADDDRLYGGDDNDWMDGGDGYNVYYAGNGDDVIIGGAGRDRMKGEAGSDACNGNGGLLDSAETCEVVSNVP